MIDPNSPAPISMTLLAQVSEEEKLVEFKSKSEHEDNELNRIQDCIARGPLDGIGNDGKGLGGQS